MQKKTTNEMKLNGIAQKQGMNVGGNNTKYVKM